MSDFSICRAICINRGLSKPVVVLLASPEIREPDCLTRQVSPACSRGHSSMTGSTSIPSSKTDRMENRPASAAQLESVPVENLVYFRLGP